MIRSEEGTVIDKLGEQSKKAFSPTYISCEPDSNVTLERESHRAKQYSPTRSTDEGMQIDDSDTQLTNAKSPMNASSESLSNMTVARDRHLAKHRE
jgi:hypothetical protein